MNEDERPLLLVVSEDPDRLAHLRLLLRQNGILSAAGRSLEIALNLLTQVIVDGCVLAQPLTPDDLQRLTHAVHANQPRSILVSLEDPGASPETGWECCQEESLVHTVHRLLNEVKREV